MVEEDIVKWIRNQRALGYTDDQIENSLIDRYSKKEIKWFLKLSELKELPTKTQILFGKFGKVMIWVVFFVTGGAVWLLATAIFLDKSDNMALLGLLTVLMVPLAYLGAFWDKFILYLWSKQE